MNKIWTQLFLAVLIAACSGAVGYGFSQREIGIQVAVNTRVIQSLQDADNAIRKDFDAERQRTDTRIVELVGLVKEVIKMDTELITLIRVQNQMKP